MPEPIYIVPRDASANDSIAPELLSKSESRFSASLGSTFNAPRRPVVPLSIDPLSNANTLGRQGMIPFTLRDINFTPKLTDRTHIAPTTISPETPAQPHSRSTSMDEFEYNNGKRNFPGHRMAKPIEATAAEDEDDRNLPRTPSASPPSSTHDDEETNEQITRSYSSTTGFHRPTQRDPSLMPITPISDQEQHYHAYPGTRTHLSSIASSTILQNHSRDQGPSSGRLLEAPNLEYQNNNRNESLIAVFPRPPNTPPRTPTVLAKAIPAQATTISSKPPSCNSLYSKYNHSSFDERRGPSKMPVSLPPGLSMEQISIRSQGGDIGPVPALPAAVDGRKTPESVRGVKGNMKIFAPGSLSTWAPTPTFPTTSELSPGAQSSAPNLPDWAQIKSEGDMQTSLPITQISRDLDYSMRRLLNEGVFEQLLDDALGRHRFRDWLLKNERPESVLKLDMWLDTRSYGRMITAIKKGSIGLHDMYLTPGSIGTVGIVLPPQQNEEFFAALRQIVAIDVNFDSTQHALLNSLYHFEFQRFIKQQIVSHAQVQLGKFNLRDEDRDGLGDCFCLTNPRMRDHPIVLVSEGFTRVTGYDKTQIVGRNCRFLQGPGTSPQSVQRIRDGLNSGEGCTELLLNYQRDGTPFYCMLCILPLRDAGGSLVYFIGGQVNVTGLLSGNKGLSFLLADPTDAPSAVMVGNPAGEEFGNAKYALSPNMQKFASDEQNSELPTIRSLVPGTKTESAPQAAGYYQAEIAEPAPAGGRRLGFFGRRKPIEKETPSISQAGVQRVVGAEAELGGSRTLDEQLKVFEATYSKLLVFKRDTREIIFATRSLLLFLGLPCGNSKETFKSSLIHTDFVQLLWSNTPTNKELNNTLKQHVKKVIKLGMTISQDCQVKAVERTFFFSSGDKYAKLRGTRIHLTPMVERDGMTVAYVCIFG